MDDYRVLQDASHVGPGESATGGPGRGAQTAKRPVKPQGKGFSGRAAAEGGHDYATLCWLV